MTHDWQLRVPKPDKEAAGLESESKTVVLNGA